MNIPVASISRGWTRETWKVRIYEALDRLALRYLDHVVCVSQEQANRVQAAGVPSEQTTVIRNAVRTERFDHGTCDQVRQSLQDLFPSDAEKPRLLVGSAGRLSPEKGFEVLIAAAKETLRSNPDTGFLIFGDGALRDELQSQIDELGISHRVVLAGFRDDLDRVIPNLDVFALSSYTEGLPNVVLEALAASVPVVATRVGGTPEVLEHGKQGLLVPAGDSKQLATALGEVLGDDGKRLEMASRGRKHVDENFSFSAQADAYVRLIDQLKAKHG
jgi:glycosyltransferase involved in cell wall biosynthesis